MIFKHKSKKNTKIILLATMLIFILIFPVFSSCKKENVNVLVGESEVEYATVTPAPLKTLSATPTPEPTLTPIAYNENSTAVRITRGIYSFSIDSHFLTKSDMRITVTESNNSEAQKFIIEKDSKTSYCNIYSADTGSFIGVNMKGLDEPGEGMSLSSMDVYSEVRSNWIIESTDDGKVIIRAAYSPNYVITLIPEVTYEDGKSIPAEIILSAYVGSDYQKWDITSISDSKMLDSDSTNDFVKSLFNLESVKLGTSYAEVTKEYGKIESIFVKSEQPVLFEFEKNPGVFYSFHGTVLTDSDTSLNEYKKGYYTTPDKITTGHSNNDVCTGVYFVPIKNVNVIDNTGVKLSVAYTKSAIQDDVFEHCYSFGYELYTIKLECDENGLIMPDSKAVITDKLR